jgi:hypothetical protein
MPTREPRTLTPIWLSHHFPESYDRCVVIGERHVCRRCLALYPLAFAVMLLSLVGPWPGELDGWLLVLLPLPSVVEFVLEHLSVVRYQPVRQVVLTIPLAIALGRGFAIYVKDPTSRLFWGVVLVYGSVCLATAVLGARRDRGPQT